MTGAELRGWLGLPGDWPVPDSVKIAMEQVPFPADAETAMRAAFEFARATGRAGGTLAAGGRERRRR